MYGNMSNDIAAYSTIFHCQEFLWIKQMYAQTLFHNDAYGSEMYFTNAAQFSFTKNFIPTKHVRVSTVKGSIKTIQLKFHICKNWKNYEYAHFTFCIVFDINQAH